MAGDSGAFWNLFFFFFLVAITTGLVCGNFMTRKALPSSFSGASPLLPSLLSVCTLKALWFNRSKLFHPPFLSGIQICRLLPNALNQVRQLPVLWVAFQKNQDTGWNSSSPPISGWASSSAPSLDCVRPCWSQQITSLTLYSQWFQTSRLCQFCQHFKWGRTRNRFFKQPTTALNACFISSLSWVNHNLGHSFASSLRFGREVLMQVKWYCTSYQFYCICFQLRSGLWYCDFLKVS